MPDWTGNGSVTWTQPLRSDWKIVSTLDYSYVGNSYSANNLVNVNGVFETRLRPNYSLVDARIALNHASWEIALVGKNLTNEHVNLGDNRALAAEVPGRPRLVVQLLVIRNNWITTAYTGAKRIWHHRFVIALVHLLVRLLTDLTVLAALSFRG